ncbi:MAG TPA: hypothetical protein VGX25_10515 [Actinophytocola sp.]|uniref:hypothetical protein n=1 Tax=Actinophytocola sp. TaxID=1872138 RepID=UPI002DDD8A58|nr:hypothetical protein [Actinophytocola sp.]HEV2779818.1 hypothetical protein [Actinophytocola sp.]
MPTTVITDEQMRALLPTTKEYTVVILRAGPNLGTPEADGIIWEHARRNFALRADGVLAIVCPIADGTDIHGVGVFNLDADATRRTMAGDPAVRAGLFTYEVHPCRSFPGDALPA